MRYDELMQAVSKLPIKIELLMFLFLHLVGPSSAGAVYAQEGGTDIGFLPALRLLLHLDSKEYAMRFKISQLTCVPTSLDDARLHGRHVFEFGSWLGKHLGITKMLEGAFPTRGAAMNGVSSNVSRQHFLEIFG